MDVTCSALSGLRSIFDSVRFNFEHLAEKYLPQHGITVAEKVKSSPKRFKVEEVNRDVQLEALSLILKIWLRRIHLLEEEGRTAIRNFKTEINNTQKNVIEPYKAILLSSESKEPGESLMRHTNLEEACTRLLTEKEKANFDMLEEDRRRLNMESAFVSSVLGLKIDFLDCLEEMKPEFRGHWTLEEWIVTFLQKNYQSMKTIDKTSLTKDLLGEMGFDPSSAAIETILKRANEMQHHIEACEWAKIFIADEFKYNPLLSTFVPKFPVGESSGFHHPSKPGEESESGEQQRHLKPEIVYFVSQEQADFLNNAQYFPFVRPTFSVDKLPWLHLTRKPEEESGNTAKQHIPKVSIGVTHARSSIGSPTQDFLFVPPKFSVRKSPWFHLTRKPEEDNAVEQHHPNVSLADTHVQGSIRNNAEDFLRDRGLLDDQRYTLLFHGTDHQSAANILNRGIYLPAGRQKRDFSSGKGFYVTASLDQAIKWARSTTSKPAILIFKVKRDDLLQKARKLDLTSDLEEWRETVHYFRSDEGPAYKGKGIRKKYDLIEGPVATASSSSGTSDQLMWQPKHSSYQLCLISDEFAKKFYHALQFILLDSRL